MPEYNQLEIIALHKVALGATSIIFKPLGGWQPHYKPGQFLTLVFFTKHGEKRRSYSMSSSPLLNEPLTITLKRVENGEFSRLLHSHAKIGDVLYCSGISGFFTLPEAIPQPTEFVFFAAGSGITPCYSLIKTILASGTQAVKLFYSSRSREETIFYDELISLAANSGEQFKLDFFFSNIMDVQKGRLGYFRLQELLEKNVNIQESIFYVCGPWDYMQMVKLSIKGLSPQARITMEHFSTLPRLSIPKPPDTDEHLVTIHFNENVYQLPVQYPDNILSAALKNNIKLPYSCRAGRCGSCAATCLTGKIWMAYNEVLVEEEMARGRILTCQAYPVEMNATIEV